MKFGIGAIFKDEFDYILEWLAWHRLAGFSSFFIVDNGSTDGTRQLLEALAEAGLITLSYLPPQKEVQLLAYQKILDDYGDQVDGIAFIDADEFIYSDDGIKPVDHLQRLFSEADVGAVGINWRIFGSSGKIEQEPGLVIERFLHCAKDEHKTNTYTKTVVRPAIVIKEYPHRSVIHKDFRYMNCEGNNIVFLNDNLEVCQHSSGRAEITKSPLRVNHYVIKSLQEFTDKKCKRGDVMKGLEHNRGHQFFVGHDINDVEFSGAALFADAVLAEMREIEAQLRLKSAFYTKCKAVINFQTTHVGGWAVFETGTAKIMIFVNGVLRAKVGAFRYRADVIKAGVSQDGCCGFRHEFNPPLKTGDVVNISLYANPFKFKKSTFTVGELSSL